MIIGVFDSGRGGEVLAQEIRAAFPDNKVITELDVKNVPYGTKTPDQIYELTRQGLERLVAQGADILVLACNTASTIIDRLRLVVSKPIVGVQPMVKPAVALSLAQTIAVFATPATLSAKSYLDLKGQYAEGCKVIEPDCEQWSSMIQHDAIDWEVITDEVESAIEKGADVLVLGCTHYHVLEDKLIELVGDRAVVLQPSKAIIAQIRTLL